MSWHVMSVAAFGHPFYLLAYGYLFLLLVWFGFCDVTYSTVIITMVSTIVIIIITTTITMIIITIALHEGV